MAKINKPQAVKTHEGAKGRAFPPEQELRRAVMSCMLWEDQFYESGVSIAERIANLVPLVEPETVAAIAISAREDMKLRHAPLLLVREMARHEGHKALVAATLVVVGAERCYRSITSRIAGLVQPVTIPEPGRTPVCRQPHVLPVLVWAARISERGPPLFA